MRCAFGRVLDTVTFGSSREFDSIRLIPAFPSRSSTLRYLLLDEAAQRDLVEISEVDTTGSVGQLRLLNKADVPVLILDGTTLNGSQQNRAINLSTLLAAGTETIIRVSCVEQGRWRLDRACSAPSEQCDADLRRAMSEQTHVSLVRACEVAVDQGLVWTHVSKTLARTQTASSTQAYEAAYRQAQPMLAQYQSHLPYPRGATGVAVLVDDALVSFDLFDKPETLEKVWPRIVRSAALGTLNRPAARRPKTDLRELLEQVIRAPQGVFTPLGLGTHHRFKSAHALASGLAFQGQVVHLAGFTIPQPG